MKITRINYLSRPAFNGIKVTKKQDDEVHSGKNNQRQAQKEILDSWESQLGLIDALIEKTPVKNLHGLKQRLETDGVYDYLHNYSRFETGVKKDGKIEYTPIRADIEAQNPALKNRLDYTDKMFETTAQSMDKILKLDKQDFENGANAPLYAALSSNKGVDSVAGYKYEMDVLTDEFINRVAREKTGEDIEIFGSILFFGPNSNGKTHITKAVAQASDCNIVKIRTAAITNNAKQAALEEIKNTALESQERFKKDRIRTIIFIDEIDKLIGENSAVTKDFEDFIKNCSKDYHCTVFAATNEPLVLGLDMDDPEVFPIKMSIEPPESPNTEEIFKYYLSNYQTGEIDYKELAQAVKMRENETMRKFNIGQIEVMCDSVEFEKQGTRIEQRDLLDLISKTRPELNKEMIDQFNEDKKRLIES